MQMSDADLIYSALLRAERKLEKAVELAGSSPTVTHLTAAMVTARTIREEIGNGLAKRPVGE
jgi:hypothetical protein